MQESLNLIQIPKLDTSRLSSVGEFRRTVARIERKYNINLEFNDNARWRPGSYERLKGQVIHALFPQWEKPKGANTIRRLVKNSRYNCDQLANDLRTIDDELRLFRSNKQSLDMEKANLEGQMLLLEYMNEITRPNNNVQVEITSLPYWARTRRSQKHDQRHEIMEDNWDLPLHPEIGPEGDIQRFNISNKSLEEKLKVYNLNTNPKRWFINIIIPLDASINYYGNREEKKILATNNYGELVVCFTLPIYDAVLNYRYIKVNNLSTRTLHRRLNTNYYSNHTFKFPYVSSTEHPFVNRGRNRYSYQMGNTCFGDFNDDVLMALSTGMMGQLHAILTKWVSTYHLGNTSPLNQPETHHISMPKEWVGTLVTDYIGTDIARCRNAVRDGMDPNVLMQNFCNNCALSEKNDERDMCTYFTRLTAEPLPVPSEYLAYIDNMIENRGLPGYNTNGTILGCPSKKDAINLIKQKAAELWNYTVNSDELNVTQILLIFHVNDMGSGNIAWDMFEDIVATYGQNIIEYPEYHDYQALAHDFYLIYRYCERIYWLNSIGTYDTELRDNLECNNFNHIDKAEKKLPIVDLRSMVNANRLSNNRTLYPEYFFILENPSIVSDEDVAAFLYNEDQEAPMSAEDAVREIRQVNYNEIEERGPTNERNPF